MLDDEEKGEALLILMTCIQAARQRLWKMRVEGKRPTMHDLESIGGVLYNAEWRVHEMAGIQKELQPAPPFYSDEWPEEVVKVLGLSQCGTPACDTDGARSLLRRFLWLSPPAASRRPGSLSRPPAAIRCSTLTANLSLTPIPHPAQDTPQYDDDHRTDHCA